MRPRSLGNEQRVALSRVYPVWGLYFYATSPQLCPTISEHYARSDNGHKALMPVVNAIERFAYPEPLDPPPMSRL